ncbi:helix-turn-helix domain-containing protein [Cytobacillus luteolus]|uniref:helix-turn-helix domain-containing protein n=1 Tax=Litchfieldia luteola TaxID=682179 RepID=UPI001CB24FE9|nr:helix-turn-helix transcriptional regulator [Cytobacillus luteolus]MBP1942242.1 transcriptional regulator with XRE-family HTH domain [Cytobacillus luteolus]
MNIVGERIRGIRKHKGLTQEELADITGLQHSYIGGIERGERNISLLTLEKIISGLGIMPNEIFNFSEVPINADVNKEELILLHSNFMRNRSMEEVNLIHKITKDIILVIDEKGIK